MLFKFHNELEIHYVINCTFAHLLPDHAILVCQKAKNTSFNSNANYRREMKLIPVNMDYCLLKFGALNFCLEVCLHDGHYVTLIFLK